VKRATVSKLGTLHRFCAAKVRKKHPTAISILLFDIIRNKVDLFMTNKIGPIHQTAINPLKRRLAAG
jgi:hypothetical protein